MGKIILGAITIAIVLGFFGSQMLFRVSKREAGLDDEEKFLDNPCYWRDEKYSSVPYKIEPKQEVGAHEDNL